MERTLLNKNNPKLFKKIHCLTLPLTLIQQVMCPYQISPHFNKISNNPCKIFIKDINHKFCFLVLCLFRLATNQIIMKLLVKAIIKFLNLSRFKARGSSNLKFLIQEKLLLTDILYITALVI